MPVVEKGLKGYVNDEKRKAEAVLRGRWRGESFGGFE